MTASGHYITALTLGLAVSGTIIHPYYGGAWPAAFADLIHWSAAAISEGIFSAPDCTIAFMFLAGTAIGAYLPDWAELSFVYNQIRHSFIPHRTYTHTLSLWILAIIGAFLALYWVEDTWYFLLSWFGLGLACASFLHVVVDMMSPTGIPLLLPNGPKISFPVYTTGHFSEMKVIVPIVLSGVGYLYLLNY